MSYRTLKRLLGETSLERKCRFLFGGGLMLLITGSFYFYARQTTDLVYEQNENTGRLLVSSIMLETHWKAFENDEDVQPVIDELGLASRPEELRKYDWVLVKADPTRAEPTKRPADDEGYEALLQLGQGEREVIRIDEEEGEYRYYGAVRAEKSCLRCHHHRYQEDEGGQLVDTEEGELLGMAKITFPLKQTKSALNRNYAILWTTAIVTTFLAMLAAYAIVRYVIVKPVLHLKNVSDEIARGTLDLRADIRTGDEFEELSHAFNRMLRHLVTVQDELREVNTDLDSKVDQLAHVNLRLYEMNKLKDEFLATMSHELRTPLNSILGFSDVLAKAPNLEEKQLRFVNHIQRSGRDLMLLINDILDLAKIESGKMELQIVEFTLAELIHRQVSALVPMAEKKNIELSIEYDADIPPLKQDSSKLQQILNNLLTNAVKFTPEGGRVRVDTRLLNGDQFCLFVEDTGIGIPLEDQETIFEKFRQGQTVPGQRDAMTREHGGTGLGLSIVKELSRLLGGEVHLESEFGKGSTFSVRLPIHLEPEHPLDAHLTDALLHGSDEVDSGADDFRSVRSASSDSADADETADADESAA